MPHPSDTLVLDPDRLLPAERETRAIARDLFARVESAAIISPHGHVDPTLLAEDRRFEDPAELLITRDHYVTRLLHAGGVRLGDLGVGAEDRHDSREIWRAFAANWHLFAGTASGYWLTHELATLFELDEAPSAQNADAQHERIARRLDDDDFRPRALFSRFGIEVLATTDDPLDDLAAHSALAQDPSFTGRVVPTFRPDAYIDATLPGFAANVERLAAHSGFSPDDYDAYIDALEARRAYFVQHGAVSADHGMLEPYTADLERAEAARLFGAIVGGTASALERREFGGHMLLEMARMSVTDGLVMTVHPGVARNHSTSTFERFGPDTGHDIPVQTEYTRNLRPLLERFGTREGFHLVLFSVDETVYSREVAPLAGFYPSVFVGAPWWFLDAPDAILRFRAATTETAGFYRGAGFIDDTRAFLSIPARHDTARRVDAAFLARLVTEGRLPVRDAERIIVDLVETIPRKAFKL